MEEQTESVCVYVKKKKKIHQFPKSWSSTWSERLQSQLADEDRDIWSIKKKELGLFCLNSLITVQYNWLKLNKTASVARQEISLWASTIYKLSMKKNKMY